MKDRFSKQAEAYRQYRPEYPAALFTYILQHLKGRESAWDCGTGNGQVAATLADYFQEVDATDISENQLKNAIEKPNVYYQLASAEHTHFDEDTFDLVTVAQAVHLFSFDEFYAEVRRVAKAGAVLAVWGYGLFRVNPEIDAIVDDFYKQVTGPYWGSERRYIDEEYNTIPFPFAAVGEKKEFNIYKQWTHTEVAGFLNTWTAIQKYRQENGENPVDALLKKLEQLWPANEAKEINFPVFLRLGRI